MSTGPNAQGAQTAAPRILWHSAPPWSSSAYGAQTRSLAREFRRSGIEVTLSAAMGLHDQPVQWDGFTVVPSPGGRDSVGAWAHRLLDPTEGDRVVTLVDAWRLAGQQLEDVPAVAWTTFETVPATPRGLTALAASRAQPVAVSAFVAELLVDAGHDRPPVISHGIDTSAFAPLVGHDRVASRQRARRELELDDDAFVIGMVATNAQASINRKSIPEVVVAAARFAKAHPRSVLWVHTNDPSGSVARGLDLRRLITASEIDPERVRISPAPEVVGGTTDASMAVLYNAFDVLCQPSGGEGFCLPLIEAQACGIPVVASDFSAQPEHVGVGRLVDGHRRWVPELHAEMLTPSIAGICDALEAIASSGDSGFEEACEFGRRYDVQRSALPRWLELLSLAPDRLDLGPATR